jgi:hypothetical protein
MANFTKNYETTGGTVDGGGARPLDFGTVNQMQQNNTKEPIYYILVTAGVLVAGYFAYKKFKK